MILVGVGISCPSVLCQSVEEGGALPLFVSCRAGSTGPFCTPMSANTASTEPVMWMRPFELFGVRWGCDHIQHDLTAGINASNAWVVTPMDGTALEPPAPTTVRPLSPTP